MPSEIIKIKKKSIRQIIMIIIIVALILIFIKFFFEGFRESFRACSQDKGSDTYGFNNYVDYYANWNYSPYFTPLPAKENSYEQYYSDLPMITDKWLVG